MAHLVIWQLNKGLKFHIWWCDSLTKAWSLTFGNMTAQQRPEVSHLVVWQLNKGLKSHIWWQLNKGLKSHIWWYDSLTQVWSLTFGDVTAQQRPGVSHLVMWKLNKGLKSHIWWCDSSTKAWRFTFGGVAVQHISIHLHWCPFTANLWLGSIIVEYKHICNIFCYFFINVYQLFLNIEQRFVKCLWHITACQACMPRWKMYDYEGLTNIWSKHLGPICTIFAEKHLPNILGKHFPNDCTQQTFFKPH